MTPDPLPLKLGWSTCMRVHVCVSVHELTLTLHPLSPDSPTTTPTPLRNVLMLMYILVLYSEALFPFAALSCVGSLLIYPLGITIENEIGHHTYGYGYGLGWGAAFFNLAAAICMCLDDVVRAVTKGFCCCRKKQSDSNV